MKTPLLLLARALLVFPAVACCAADAPPASPAPSAPAAPAKLLVTPWAAKMDPQAPLPEYPRPQLQRDTWVNLNGEWDYAIQPRGANTPPPAYDGKIVVPFAVESQLSGVQKTVRPSDRLWYRRTFPAPTVAKNSRVWLRFGAVDWQAEVYFNGQLLARHEGGYDPFGFDITDLIKADAPQELVVAVWDPTDTGSQPRGKQVLDPANIFYTSVTGIWQTVWLDISPGARVRDLTLTPDFDHASVHLSLKLGGPRANAKADVRVLAAGKEVARTEITQFGSLIDFTTPVEIKLPEPHAWSPEDPFLYQVEITYSAGGFEDKVKSYFGLRKIERKLAGDGHERLFLNNQPVFMYGPLDQGWWPDGLYTAPTDEALRWDVAKMKEMGFNMVRKHVKVEPARWYYHCDTLGLLVWQDMPSALQEDIASHVPPRQQALDGIMAPLADAQFRRELSNMIDQLRAFPSIVVWVPFNECWGQHNTNEILASVKQLDPTRLVDGPSGWNDLGFGDMIDMHDYPGPGMFPARLGRASVLGEFGGLGLPVSGHLWQQDKNWGYRDFGSAEEMTKQYEAMIAKLRVLRQSGLAAAVYTQLTDIETEVNGMITYDRQITKIPAEKLAELHRGLIAPEQKP